MEESKPTVPIIDISVLYSGPLSSLEAYRVSQELYKACSTWGFFQVIGHRVSTDLQKDLVSNARDFFTLPDDTKKALHVENGGVAWRGYMPQGGEGTHGRVDRKEGMYFGPEHPADHCHSGLPLHGKNQFPDEEVPAMRANILQYIDEVTELGKIICDAMSLSLGLDGHFIRDNYLQPEPVALLRAFRYLPRAEDAREGTTWGIGEHTDFGLLTILKHTSPGLQILSPQKEWVDVEVMEDAFVCNVGDMLDMITHGRFKTTAHRVRSPTPGTDRISFPFFFDFSWNAKMAQLPLDHLPALSEVEQAEAQKRWDSGTFKAVNGEWWQYLAKKVQKVFPKMGLPDFEDNVKPSSRFIIAVAT